MVDEAARAEINEALVHIQTLLDNAQVRADSLSLIAARECLDRALSPR